MESRERALLKKVEYWYSYEFPEGDLYASIKEIRKLLAKPEPEQEQEPELTVTQREAYQRGYAQAERDLKRKPLSEGMICLIYDDTEHSVAFARAIEKEHGIGENNE
jgi:hypothetical protein